jgi:hydrogenase nickel incorporation protein HypA/HybF
MHELSIAQNIIELVQKSVPEPEWKNVSAVRLKIGEVAGVIPDSLEFSFNVITSESQLRNARLEIESVPFRIHCNKCDSIIENEMGFSVCSKCGSTDTKVISGMELNVTEIELNEMEKELS